MSEQPNYYAVIPAEVRYDRNLSASEKLLYGEIAALCNKEGFCWALNSYFEKLYGVSERTVTGWISKLAKEEHINIEFTKDETGHVTGRKLFLSPQQKTAMARLKKTAGGRPKKTSTNNNTSINKTSINDSAPAGTEEFNSISNMKAEQEIECQTIWNKILQVWITTESAPILKQAYKKFRTFGTEHQQEVLVYLQGLSPNKSQYLKGLWISTYLKSGLFHPGIIDKDLEKIVNLEAQRTAQRQKPGNVKNNLPDRNNY